MPVNWTPSVEVKDVFGAHNKIEKFLKAKKKSKLEILPSLTDLYDEQLNLRKVNFFFTY